MTQFIIREGERGELIFETEDKRPYVIHKYDQGSFSFPKGGTWYFICQETAYDLHNRRVYIYKSFIEKIKFIYNILVNSYIDIEDGKIK